MDLSIKYRKVVAWLDDLYAGQPVGQFERNECTIDVLYQLMQKNMAADEDTQLVVQDLRQKATEYTAEAQRLDGVLTLLNLKRGTLSQSGLMSLRMLANLAWLLRIRDASDTSYLLALQSLQDERDGVHEEFLAEERLLTQLTRKTKDALVKHTAILKTYQDLEDQADQQAARMEKSAKDTTVLRGKAHEYAKLLDKLKDTLSRTGVNSSLFHGNLIKRAQDLQKLEDELKPLKQKLQDYHDLPADISQAKLKLAELRKDVARIEAELSKKIDTMKL